MDFPLDMEGYLVCYSQSFLHLNTMYPVFQKLTSSDKVDEIKGQTH